MVKYTIGIVGGSGYIGLALANRLKKSFNITIIDITSPKKPSGNIEFLKCDIKKLEDLKRCLSDVDLVIHTAIIQIPLINEKKRLGYDVNILGTQNVCKIVDENPRIKGLILTSSWHVFGENGLKGVLNEEFGFRPDKVQDRARLYALCKVAQEIIVRIYDEMSEKIFGVIRLGTVLGDGMPKKTAANLFISKGLKGEALTPYSDSMYRPMLYVDLSDIQRGFESYAKKLLNGEIVKNGNSVEHIVNLCYPKPVTILELATVIKDQIRRLTDNQINPKIEVVDVGNQSVFAAEDRELIKVDVTKAKQFLGMEIFVSPHESLEKLIRQRIAHPN